MMKVNTHRVGLVWGGLFGAWHLVWALMVWIGIAKPVWDFIIALHFIDFELTMRPFSWTAALGLIIITSIIGYVAGTIVALVWNWMQQEQS